MTSLFLFVTRFESTVVIHVKGFPIRSVLTVSWAHHNNMVLMEEILRYTLLYFSNSS
jgi:hypothetical protein